MNEANIIKRDTAHKGNSKDNSQGSGPKTTRDSREINRKDDNQKTNHQAHFQAETATKRTVGETPAPIINRTSPEQFGRVNVLGITPSAENGLYPARVELGEAFKVTAQVFIEKAAPRPAPPCPCATRAAPRRAASR